MYQKLTFVGNLGRDPEMRYLPDGTAVTNLNVATNRSWNDNRSGEQHQETTWFRVTVWGAQADACNTYLTKGQLVLVEGTLKPDPETGNPKIFTRQDGSAGASFEVNAQIVRFLGRNEVAVAETEPDGSWAGDEEDEDDIPF